MLKTPGGLIFFFNVFTLILFFISPFDYSGGSKYSAILYVFLCQFLFLFGYVKGVDRSSKLSPSRFFNNDVYFGRLFKFIFNFYCVTFIFKYAYLLRFDILDIAGMIDFLIRGIMDPQFGYMMALDKTRISSYPWQLYFFVAITNSIFFISSFIFWKNMSTARRSLFSLLLLVEVFYWFGRATNFGIVLLVISFIFSFLSSRYFFGFRDVFKFSLGLLLTVLSFIGLMSFRLGDYSQDLLAVSLPLVDLDQDGWFFVFIPEVFRPSLLLIFSYLCQGYFYLIVAFNMDFVFTYFGGWNAALNSIYEGFGFEVYSKTYISRMQDFGVDPLINWHSAYVWFASDFTFFGLPILWFFWGFFVGSAWLWSVRDRDFLSGLIFVVLASCAIFSFSNTNIFSFFLFSGLFFFPFWIFFRYVKT